MYNTDTDKSVCANGYVCRCPSPKRSIVVPTNILISNMVLLNACGRSALLGNSKFNQIPEQNIATSVISNVSTALPRTTKPTFPLSGYQR